MDIEKVELETESGTATVPTVEYTEELINNKITNPTELIIPSTPGTKNGSIWIA